jgi:hypothetical protein
MLSDFFPRGPGIADISFVIIKKPDLNSKSYYGNTYPKPSRLPV